MNKRRSIPNQIHLKNVLLRDRSTGVKDGINWRKSEAFNDSPGQLQEAAHKNWSQYFHRRAGGKGGDWKVILQRGKSYTSGFMKGVGLYSKIIPVPLRNTASAVVCACNRAIDLQSVLKKLSILPLKEIVVVLHNASDEMFTIARNYKNTVVVHFPEAVDPDVERSLGAKLTSANTLLFVDGEQAVDANILARFIWECESRVDIALNDISTRLGLFYQRAGIERFHEFLNRSLNRKDLKANSLSSLPFALSRHALDTMGISNLAVPAKAHAMAILGGLRIGIGGAVKSSSHYERSASNEKWRRAAGDHIEAWREAMTAQGSRLNFADSTRNRSVLGEWER
ncbi:hypothetical protein [Cohnella silvisoli]|uniref:Glycosyltransferase n=1 Tax=Cohnella silvisoli TaxID=2873699 RepID=A0ABV1L1V4_9BACL|nr:hypothetical protein [Cohnella silvisoli]MCD9025966.1 hypothetical protein [Cohnella silvisoli]